MAKRELLQAVAGTAAGGGGGEGVVGMNNQYDRVIHIVIYIYISMWRTLTGLVVVEWRLDWQIEYILAEIVYMADVAAASRRG